MSFLRVLPGFRFGDDSPSHSEKYRLEIRPIDGPGDRPRGYSWLDARYGVPETKCAMLKPGWSYEVRLDHAGTDPDYHDDPCPDYDYVLQFVGADSSPSVILDDPQGLFGGNDNSGESFTGEGKVATIKVEKAALMFCNPEDGDWNELEQSRVVLDNEKLKIKISISPKLDTKAQCIDALGDSLVLKTAGTCSSGVSISLGADAEWDNSDPACSMLKITKTRSQVKALGLLPHQDDDGIDEMAWIDMASGKGQSLVDSEAFSGLGFIDRGTASSLDPSRTLYSEPPNSIPSVSYFKAAGREIVTASYGGVESSRRQIMNQADILYYSGHGASHNGNLYGPGAFVYDLSPRLVEGWWGRDMKCSVFSACSVLDINDYNGNFEDPTLSHSHGKEWEAVGPPIMLGYNYKAPGDAGGATTRIVNQWRTNRAAQGDVEAWMAANAANKAWNACAIVKENRYLYFKKRRWGRRSVISVNKGDW